MERDLSVRDFGPLLLDGKRFGKGDMVTALGITLNGRNRPVQPGSSLQQCPGAPMAELLRALRIVVRADSDSIRQALFAHLLRANTIARLVHSVHRILRRNWASALLVAGYGLRSFLTINPPRGEHRRIVAVGVHANALHQLDRVAALVGPGEIGRVRTNLSALLWPSTIARLLGLTLSRHHCRRALRLVHAVNCRHDFLVSCRVASTLACYARARSILKSGRAAAVLVSSESNPEEVAFASAARALHIPTIFVSHAYTTPVSPPLDFSLSLLEGEAALEAHRRKGVVKGQVLLIGQEGASAPLDLNRFSRSSPVIGIFAPKAVNWDTFAAVITDCRHRFHARQILIRWHPSMLERPRLDRTLGSTAGVVESSGTEILQEVASRCDWIVADESSNVHLPVLRLGIPTISVKNIGETPEDRSDLYRFVAARIVFPPVVSLADLPLDAVKTFFSDDWSERFRRYDVSYLRPGLTVDTEVRQAIRSVAGDT